MAVVERTNNVPEHFFGREKQRLRRRLGRACLGRDLEQQPAQAALVANLTQVDYVRVVCGSLDNLPDAFATLDPCTVADSSPRLRDHRDSELLRCVRALLGREDASLPECEREPTGCLAEPATVS